MKSRRRVSSDVGRESEKEFAKVRRLYIVGAIGLLLSIATAVVYLYFARDNAQSTISFVASETFKAVLTFTLVALGGALIKGAVDASLDEQRAHRSHSEQSKERQTEIVTEFVEVFSQFYGVRKLYHSAYSKSNKIYVEPSEEYEALMKELLKKSVELEGRYGALKTLTIQHFGLPDSDLRTKSVVELKKRIREQQDVPTLIRLRLDLLGELYDDWRHAIEQKRWITESLEVWENYEVLLKYLIEADTPQREGARNGVKSQVFGTGAKKMEKAIPILPADDLRIAKEFYVDRLGFDVRFEATEDGATGLLGIDRGAISLTLDSPMSGHGREACVSLQVEDADAYYDEWRNRVEIRRPPKNEPWGARTFDVIDPFGNTIFVMGPVT